MEIAETFGTCIWLLPLLRTHGPAPFTIFYTRTYKAGMNHQYIIIDWQWSGFYSFNAQKVLERFKITQYWPELRPPQSSVNLTPQDDWEYREISDCLAVILTWSGKALQKQLNSAYYEVFSADKILFVEFAAHHKRSLKNEERPVSKHLKNKTINNLKHHRSI